MPMIQVNGTQLHYHVQGRGTPILFLHPACIGSRVFTYLWNDLGRDYLSLRFDFRGHGRSGTSDERLTIPILAEDTLRLMDQLEIPAAYLCSYSIGTMVALEAMLKYPERILGAVLLGGMAEISDWRTRAKLIMGNWAGRLKAKAILAFPQLLSNADNIESYRRMREETVAGDIVKWCEYMESALRYSAVSRLRDIKQPVLLLCGERDRAIKQDIQTLMAGLTNAAFAKIPGKKHTLPTHAAAETGSLIRSWLHQNERKIYQ